MAHIFESIGKILGWSGASGDSKLVIGIIGDIFKNIEDALFG